ncbi:hypothetical protein [Kluyvera georgiana]|uniref:hypothetical protein n=1 Tax=Kluyvera georgiana TaxID=73098 RepID=UPI003AEF33D8
MTIEIMKMNYEEQTPYILVDHQTPVMNSLPFHRVFVGNKLVKKELKQHNGIENVMNIAFEKEPDSSTGDVLDWSLRDLEFSVVVLAKDKIFVKGMHLWLMVVGVIE